MGNCAHWAVGGNVEVRSVLVLGTGLTICMIKKFFNSCLYVRSYLRWHYLQEKKIKTSHNVYQKGIR